MFELSGRVLSLFIFFQHISIQISAFRGIIIIFGRCAGDESRHAVFIPGQADRRHLCRGAIFSKLMSQMGCFIYQLKRLTFTVLRNG